MFRKLGLLAVALWSGMTMQAQEDWNPLTDINKDNFYIYIVFGQSNAEGYAAQPEAADKVPNANLYNLTAYDDYSGADGTGTQTIKWGTWENVSEPNCRKFGNQRTKMGWVKSFGEEMLAKNPGKKFGFVHVAVASASIKLFDKDQVADYLAASGTSKWVKIKAKAAYADNPYNRIIEAAKKAQEFGTIKGILMHQGEEDGWKAYWPETVKKVYTDMLADLNLDGHEVPLILGEPTAANGAIPNQTAITTPTDAKYIPNSYLVKALDLPYIADNSLHFTHDGYVELGKRYAEKASELLATAGIEGVETSTASAESVKVSLKADGLKVTVSSSQPVKTAQVLGINGSLLRTLTPNGALNFDLNVEELGTSPLVLVVTTVNGAKTSLKLTSK